MQSWQSLTQITNGISRRSSSYDRSGGNLDFVTFGTDESHTLLDVQTSGVVQHIWITIDSKDPNYRRNLVLRMTWDNHEFPSVECPIGDFFGNGWGLTYNFSSPFLACAPQNGRALVCYFPMPFKSGAKIEVINQSPDFPVERLYYYVDYEESPIPTNTGYFHAFFNQELTEPENAERDENEWFLLRPYGNHPTDQDNFLIVETQGKGHLVGLNYYVNNPGPMWYGEGDDMILIDGEPWPGLHGTGTEDYFNTSWSPDQKFDNPSFGLARVPGTDNNDPKFGWMGRTHLYRFHHLDPIRFQKSLKFTIEHGHDNCLSLELATVAYTYQTLITTPLNPLPDLKSRIPQPLTTESDLHLWRTAWLKNQG